MFNRMAKRERDGSLAPMRWSCGHGAFASSRVTLFILIALVTALSACARGPLPATALRFADATDPLIAEGFGACASDQPDFISLNSDEPLVVIVHGCLSSGHEFKKLSEVFEFHGQQSICFNYDHRRTLRGTAIRLRRGLDALRARIPNRPITLLGHSQGGLVSRIALAELDDEVNTEQRDLRLVTVSSPFSGIHASSISTFRSSPTRKEHAEQDNAIMSEDPRVEVARISAGHAEVVGGGGVDPGALIEVLQEFEVLAATRPERAEALVTLIRTLFNVDARAPLARFSQVNSE